MSNLIRQRIVRENKMKHIVIGIVTGITITLLTIGFILLVSLAVEDFNADVATWRLQNDCISHWVSMGVERSEIYRTAYGCDILIGEEL